MATKDKHRRTLLIFIDEITGLECVVMNSHCRYEKKIFSYVIRNADSKDILYLDRWKLYPTENIEDIKAYCSKTASQLDELREKEKDKIKKQSNCYQRMKDLK